jgi:hypothetical protein
MLYSPNTTANTILTLLTTQCESIPAIFIKELLFLLIISLDFCS